MHSQISNSKRNSSVEVFRMLATFLVLIVHINGIYAGGMPDKLIDFSVSRIGQAFIEAFSIPCVNCFLIITGWYGLRFSWKHIWTIWSILVWIYIPFYIVTVLFLHNFSITQFIYKLLAIPIENYYVQCYLMLLFLSPILNVAIIRYGKKLLPYTISFWLIEIIFDWILKNQCLAFGHGYMLTHFIFMYILGQTLVSYRNEINIFLTKALGIGIYLIGIFLIVGFYLILPKEIVFAYTNPINVIMAVSLFLFFEQYNYYNKMVNWISKSTLAVYICHITTPMSNILQKWDVYAIQKYSYFEYVCVMAITVLCIFIFSILYDKIRLILFSKPISIISSIFSQKLKKYSII